jgi:hypothetical protein
VDVLATRQFLAWYRELEKAAGEGNELARRRLRRVRTMLRQLAAFDRNGIYESAFVRPGVQAHRYRLLRVSHVHDRQVQARLIVWQQSPTTVWVVHGGDKTEHEDTWYSMAVAVSETEVDQILRKHEQREEGRS